MWPNPQETADLVTFTEEILNEKLHFCAVVISCEIFDISFSCEDEHIGIFLYPH